MLNHYLFDNSGAIRISLTYYNNFSLCQVYVRYCPYPLIPHMNMKRINAGVALWGNRIHTLESEVKAIATVLPGGCSRFICRCCQCWTHPFSADSFLVVSLFAGILTEIDPRRLNKTSQKAKTRKEKTISFVYPKFGKRLSEKNEK